VSKEDLGAKRTCPETGKKFYDLNKDPVVSPYTGKSYPRSFFVEAPVAKPRKEAAAERAPVKEKAVVEDDTELEADADGPVLVPLEEADGDVAEDEEDDASDTPDIPDLPEVEDEDQAGAEETFLEADEDEDDDLAEVFEGGKDSEET
jgi:uncharacterized protein (TIGR02300 family)